MHRVFRGRLKRRAPLQFCSIFVLKRSVNNTRIRRPRNWRLFILCGRSTAFARFLSVSVDDPLLVKQFEALETNRSEFSMLIAACRTLLTSSLRSV